MPTPLPTNGGSDPAHRAPTREARVISLLRTAPPAATTARGSAIRHSPVRDAPVTSVLCETLPLCVWFPLRQVVLLLVRQRFRRLRLEFVCESHKDSVSCHSCHIHISVYQADTRPAYNSYTKRLPGSPPCRSTVVGTIAIEEHLQEISGRRRNPGDIRYFHRIRKQCQPARNVVCNLRFSLCEKFVCNFHHIVCNPHKYWARARW